MWNNAAAHRLNYPMCFDWIRCGVHIALLLPLREVGLQILEKSKHFSADSANFIKN